MRTRATEQGRRSERVIHFLTQDELRQLFKVIRSKRDRAIFLVAYRHGLRASEIGLLQRADMDVKQGRISIHRLKGSISGVYPIQPDVLKTIRSYICGHVRMSRRISFSRTATCRLAGIHSIISCRRMERSQASR
jgi:integrase